MSAKWRIARIDLGNGANKINKEPIEFRGFWMSFLHESLFIGSFGYSVVLNFQISRQKFKFEIARTTRAKIKRNSKILGVSIKSFQSSHRWILIFCARNLEEILYENQGWLVRKRNRKMESGKWSAIFWHFPGPTFLLPFHLENNCSNF